MRRIIDTIEKPNGYINLLQIGKSSFQVVHYERVTDSLVEPLKASLFVTKKKAEENFNSFRFKVFHGFTE